MPPICLWHRRYINLLLTYCSVRRRCDQWRRRWSNLATRTRPVVPSHTSNTLGDVCSRLATTSIVCLTLSLTPIEWKTVASMSQCSPAYNLLDFVIMWLSNPIYLLTIQSRAERVKFILFLKMGNCWLCIAGAIWLLIFSNFVCFVPNELWPDLIKIVLLTVTCGSSCQSSPTWPRAGFTKFTNTWHASVPSTSRPPT